jgi:hypothetical protein
MYRKLFKFVVTTLTILSANLLTNYISDKLVSHKWEYKPLRFTLLAMLIITVIFYPLFMWLEEWLNDLSKKLVKAGKSIAGKYVGLLFGFIIGIAILTYLYARVWYKIDLISVIFKGKFLQMF